MLIWLLSNFSYSSSREIKLVENDERTRESVNNKREHHKSNRHKQNWPEMNIENHFNHILIQWILLNSSIYNNEKKNPLDPNYRSKNCHWSVPISYKDHKQRMSEEYTKHIDHHTHCPHVYRLAILVYGSSKSIKWYHKCHICSIICEEHKYDEITNPIFGCKVSLPCIVLRHFKR